MIQKNKKIVINSYPRSGSVFLSESIFNCLKNKQLPSSIHIPELISMDNVVTVVIVRNPYDCISSDLFRVSNEENIFQNLNKMDFIVKSFSETYCEYLNKAKEVNAYLLDFAKLTTDTKNEIVKLLNKFDIDFYIDKVVNSYQDLSLAAGHLGDNNIHYGHFPRNAEKDEMYIKIKDYLLQNKDAEMAYNKYLEVIKEI